MQHFLVVYHGYPTSWHTHEPLGECVYRENASVKWDIPQYTSRKRCITSRDIGFNTACISTQHK